MIKNKLTQFYRNFKFYRNHYFPQYTVYRNKLFAKWRIGNKVFLKNGEVLNISSLTEKQLDPRTKLAYAMFQILIDYVEKECDELPEDEEIQDLYYFWILDDWAGNNAFEAIAVLEHYAEEKLPVVDFLKGLDPESWFTAGAQRVIFHHCETQDCDVSEITVEDIIPSLEILIEYKTQEMLERLLKKRLQLWS